MTVEDTLPATIYLESPLNHTWTNATNDTTNFTFYVDDYGSLSFRCLFYWDSVLAAGNDSVLRNVTAAVKSNISFTNGVHSWYVTCLDDGNNFVQSETRELFTGSYCANIDTDGLTYTLNENVSGDSSCFTVTGDNVTIDCQGNTIFFNSGSAISTISDNVTIKNCIIQQNSTAVGTGILSNGTTAISNTTIDMIGNDSTGISLSADNNSILNTSVYLHGENGAVLSMINSSENMIQGNYFSVDSSSSQFIKIDEFSLGNDISNNTYYSSAFEGFTMSFIVDPAVGANVTLPSVGKTPSLNIYIPVSSFSAITTVNITTWYTNYTREPIDVATTVGEALMYVNITTSLPAITNESNPYVLIMNLSSLNLTDEEISRASFFYYNDSTSVWESQANECNISAKTCTVYLTHFSRFALMLKILPIKIAEKETYQLPLEGSLSCTKEMAEIITEPGASVDVTFLDTPYSGMSVKSGITDENGSFAFIADLPGRYKVDVSMSGFDDNSLTFTAADDCVPRITFVRKWLDCSESSCILNMPVMTTQMKNVEIDLSDVSGILSGDLDIRDKFGGPVTFFSYSGTKIVLPLITDRFVISSMAKVSAQATSDLAKGLIEIEVVNGGETAKVSGFVLSIPDLGTNFIKNITYVANGQTTVLQKFSVSGSQIIIDQQLYVPSTAKFRIYVTPVPLTCRLSSDCPSDSTCENGTCVVIPCSCGYIIDRSCVKYECCQDSDCTSEKSCISHVCVFTPETITEEEKLIIADRLNVLITTIQSAQEEGQDVTTAIQLLDQAKVAYEAGDFERARELIAQAQEIFTITREVTSGFPYLAAVIVGVFLLILILAVLVVRRLSSMQWKKRKR